MRTKDYLSKYCNIKDGFILGNTIFAKKSNAYIGSIITDTRLIKFLARHEITEVYSFHDMRKTMKSTVACCGFSKKEQRWYGWTHRGIRSFGIGDKYFNYLGGKQAKTLEECKKLAFYAVKELD